MYIYYILNYIIVYIIFFTIITVKYVILHYKLFIINYTFLYIKIMDFINCKIPHYFIIYTLIIHFYI